MTQREVAGRIGIAEKTYAFYEKSRVPRPERLAEIADAIGVDLLTLQAGPVIKRATVEEMLEVLSDEMRGIREEIRIILRRLDGDDSAAA